MPRGKAQPKPSEEMIQLGAPGWLCGVCGEKAFEDYGYTRMDERFSVGSCSKHLKVGLTRDPDYVNPKRTEDRS